MKIIVLVVRQINGVKSVIRPSQTILEFSWTREKESDLFWLFGSTLIYRVNFVRGVKVFVYLQTPYGLNVISGVYDKLSWHPSFDNHNFCLNSSKIKINNTLNWIWIKNERLQPFNVHNWQYLFFVCQNPY